MLVAAVGRTRELGARMLWHVVTGAAHAEVGARSGAGRALRRTLAGGARKGARWVPSGYL